MSELDSIQLASHMEHLPHPSYLWNRPQTSFMFHLKVRKDLTMASQTSQSLHLRGILWKALFTKNWMWCSWIQDWLINLCGRPAALPHFAKSPTSLHYERVCIKSVFDPYLCCMRAGQPCSKSCSSCEHGRPHQYAVPGVILFFLWVMWHWLITGVKALQVGVLGSPLYCIAQSIKEASMLFYFLVCPQVWFKGARLMWRDVPSKSIPEIYASCKFQRQQSQKTSGQVDLVISSKCAPQQVA